MGSERVTSSRCGRARPSVEAQDAPHEAEQAARGRRDAAADDLDVAVLAEANGGAPRADHDLALALEGDRARLQVPLPRAARLQGADDDGGRPLLHPAPSPALGDPLEQLDLEAGGHGGAAPRVAPPPRDAADA